MAEKSTTISFVPLSDVVDDFILLELDDVKNAGRTTFNVGEKVYLRFLTPSSDAYVIKVSAGTAQTESTNIHYPITDDEKQFPNVDSGYLSYIPCTAVDYEWIGHSAGVPYFNGRRITLKQISVAVLNNNYSVRGNRLSVVSNVVGTVLIVVIQGDNQASLAITIEDEEAVGDPVAYELEARDYCTDDVLVGATIYFDNVDIGQTDENGIIALGALIPGSTHSLRMEKAGYINSENDRLNNDSFVVPL